MDLILVSVLMFISKTLESQKAVKIGVGTYYSALIGSKL